MAAISYLVVLLAVLYVVHGQLPPKSCKPEIGYVCHSQYDIELCDPKDKRKFSCYSEPIPGGFCIPGKANFTDRPCAVPEKCTGEGRKRLPGAGLKETRLCAAFSQCTAVGNNLYDLTYHECMDGFEFCETCQKCVPKEDAGCSQSLLQLPCSINKKVADPSRCDMYWFCTSELIFTKQFCNPPTPHFDTISKICVNNSTTCGTRTDPFVTIPNAAPCLQGQRFLVTDNCKQFEECDFELKRFRRNCYPADYVFEATSGTTGRCVPYSATICGFRPYIKL